MTSCKTRPGTNSPHPPLAEPLEPNSWVWVLVGLIAVPRTPKWRPRLEDDRKRIRQAWMGAPRCRARSKEEEEGAHRQRENV
ncbi:hypothetical protein PAL_GLEAN10004871 [Pteropus alecto]|uniref:Uncharacterized protein n=1 Tax=Pteropus alecto TaxID=9402 RepID=L5KVU8_PTEAL|nr:hypothetical protein PAL_GLEAN10004871 [Pteropus alecto]